MSARGTVDAAPLPTSGREVSLVAWIEALPSAPWLTGVVVFGASMLVELAAVRAMPPGREALVAYFREATVMVSATLGYMVGALPYLVRWAQGDLDEMRRALACSDAEFAGIRHSLDHHPARSVAVAALIGPGFGLLFLEANFAVLSRFAAGDHRLYFGVVIVRGLLLWTVAGALTYLAFRNARTMGRVGSAFLRLDLLDPEPARQLSRYGLRNLPFVVVVPTGFVMVVAMSALGERAVVGVAAVQVVTVVGCAGLLLIPVLGVQRQLRERKHAELERIRRALAGDRASLDESELGDEARGLGRLALLAWRREVEAVREWPLSGPLRARALFYILLPLLSWIAAALVERGIDALL